MLRQVTREVLVNYFKNVEGEFPKNFYWNFIGEIEKPMIEFLIKFTRFNQMKMAKIMGISRGTLRKMLKKYGFN